MNHVDQIANRTEELLENQELLFWLIFINNKIYTISDGLLQYKKDDESVDFTLSNVLDFFTYFDRPHSTRSR